MATDKRSGMLFRSSKPLRVARFRAEALYALPLASLVLVATAPFSAAQTPNSAEGRTTRVVHHFDFDERASGNLEDIPKYWDMLRPQGFPHYGVGEFDIEQGHDAPPSFHLRGEGRNVVFQYTGPKTRVRTNTDYRIEGFILADHLIHARACLAGHYLDRQGEPIADTLVRSRFVGGSGDDSGWVKVGLFLPAAPPRAFTIGLTAWVVQGPVWNDKPTLRRHLPKRDVRSGAWFDDLTIFALPRVELFSSAPGNVLDAEQTSTLSVILADYEDANLSGELNIHDAQGTLVEHRSYAVRIEVPINPYIIDVGRLYAGLYHAELNVFAGKTLITSRALTFARLAKRVGSNDQAARTFGIAIPPGNRAPAVSEASLLRHQLARSAKLPVWSGLATGVSSARERRENDRLIQELLRMGFRLTGVFAGPPGEIVVADGAYVRPLLELLSGDMNVWRDHLAAVVAPHASSFRWWQIGPDGDASLGADEGFALAANKFVEAMEQFITLPRLSVGLQSSLSGNRRIQAVHQITVGFGPEMSLEGMRTTVESAKRLGYERVSAYVAPLPSDEYRRLPRLANFAQRVLVARYAGAHTVFVPQTWTVRSSTTGTITEPQETFLILRTIADTLADAKPGVELFIDDGVRCLAFDHNGTSILAMWDDKAGESGREHSIQLAGAKVAIDLWGHTSTLSTDESGRSRVRLTGMPLLIPHVPTWAVQFRSAFKISPSKVTSGTELVDHTLQIDYDGSRSVSGRIDIRVPENWEASPRVFNFSVAPQRIASYPIKIRYAHNQVASQSTLRVNTTFEGGSLFFSIPLQVTIGLEDLEVWGDAVVDKNELVVRHVVTNRSSKVLSFRGAAVVPGRERQYRPISNLQPGDTQFVEYRFSNGRNLIGRSIRLVLREMNDGPRIHNLSVTVP